MLTASQENERTLARLVGISEEEAAARLAFKVAIDCAGSSCAAFGRYLRDLLAFTLDVVDDPARADLVVAINMPPEAVPAQALRIVIDDERIIITRADGAQVRDSAPHDLCAKLAACYAASVVVAHAIGADHLARLTLPFIVPFERFGLTPRLLAQTLDFHDTVLAGAGGVGSGFLWALESLDVRGTLDVSDPKPLAAGGLNRSFHYSTADIGKNKAEALCTNARLPHLTLTPFVGVFSDLCRQRFRVKRVIVTVDSRPARRTIQ